MILPRIFGEFSGVCQTFKGLNRENIAESSFHHHRTTKEESLVLSGIGYLQIIKIRIEHPLLMLAYT